MHCCQAKQLQTLGVSTLIHLYPHSSGFDKSTYLRERIQTSKHTFNSRYLGLCSLFLPLNLLLSPNCQVKSPIPRRERGLARKALLYNVDHVCWYHFLHLICTGKQWKKDKRQKGQKTSLFQCMHLNKVIDNRAAKANTIIQSILKPSLKKTNRS